MIDAGTIEDIKRASKIEEVVGDFIKLHKSGSEYQACCPFHKENTPSFKVNPKDNFYKCFGCGKAGDSISFLEEYTGNGKNKWSFQESIAYLAKKYGIDVLEEQRRDFIKPVWQNNTNLSDKTVKWFNSRGISQATLKIMRVGESKQWMPEHKHKVKKDGVETIETLPDGERNVVEFNYFRNGELVNTKYRDGAKCMRLVKGAELIFYNIDSLKGAKQATIVEGEPDTLTLIECGVQGAILSVPNGANIKSNNMAYLDSAIDLFDGIEKIYIGTDNDAAGRKLREDLAERLGKERCYYLEWKDKKDANDVLKAYGKEAVLECVDSPKEFPIEGAFAPSTFGNDVDDMYVNGLSSGCKTGMERFDTLLRFEKGYITVVTGIPSHGKSSFLDQVILKLSLFNDWKCAFYSPENKPTKLHISKMARMLIGKDWFGDNRLSRQEKDMVMRFIEGRIWFIKPKKDFTLDSILETIRILKKQKGIDCFVLDAWNRLEHKYGGNNEIKYINESLTKIDTFCEINNVHCFLVAHPTKLEKDKRTGEYPVPTPYNISGASHFYNIPANCVSIYRVFGKFNSETKKFEGGHVEVYVQKVKFQHWGEVGMQEFTYDRSSGRFNESVGGLTNFDKTNWIVRACKQSEFDLGYEPEPPQEPAIYVGNPEDSPF